MSRAKRGLASGWVLGLWFAAGVLIILEVVGARASGVRTVSRSSASGSHRYGSFTSADRQFLGDAIAEARAGFEAGGIPVGAALVIDGSVVAVGRNRRVIEGSVVRHGELDALERAGRMPASVYRRATLYTTLSPCPMCAGAIRLFGIGRVVVGENRTYLGDEELLRHDGVEVVVADDDECRALLEEFARRNPALWAEDIGVDPGSRDAASTAEAHERK